MDYTLYIINLYHCMSIRLGSCKLFPTQFTSIEMGFYFQGRHFVYNLPDFMVENGGTITIWAINFGFHQICGLSAYLRLRLR